VITGKDDALISWENSQILADRISGAKLVFLESSGYCFWLEQPQEAGEAILRFLHTI
jgi:pimeloyl-ACP methyl ester carboxylesterase